MTCARLVEAGNHFVVICLSDYRGALSLRVTRDGCGAADIGQYRATSCPICGSLDIGKWTCASCTVLVRVHRELIRNLQHWRSLYEALEVPDVLVSATNGQSYSLWDVQTFYDQRTTLPLRMHQSIQFYLFENMLESEAALRMGIADTNPVGTYATMGLTTILAKAVMGESPYILEIETTKEKVSG